MKCAAVDGDPLRCVFKREDQLFRVEWSRVLQVGVVHVWGVVSPVYIISLVDGVGEGLRGDGVAPSRRVVHVVDGQGNGLWRGELRAIPEGERQGGASAEIEAFGANLDGIPRAVGEKLCMEGRIGDKIHRNGK